MTHKSFSTCFFYVLFSMEISFQGKRIMIEPEFENQKHAHLGMNL